jgi:cysteine-rich repeat protein
MMTRSWWTSLGGAVLLTGMVGCGGNDSITVGDRTPGATGSPSVSSSGDDPANVNGEHGTSINAASVALTNCTFTIGYWKNHAEAWPVSSVTLGSITYTQAQALAILNQAVMGNGLVSLAHQLIGAKLNLAQGAASGALGTAIADADALIGSLTVPPVGPGSLDPSVTSSLNGTLDDFNSGKIGPGHCGDQPPPPPPSCGDGIVNQDSEECDGGDDCAADCKKVPPPPPPSCGDGIVNQSSEECDGGDDCTADCKNVPPPPPPSCGDGIVNQSSEECDGGDDCTRDCKKVPPPPPPCCGNGILEAGEECDDGNLNDGDGCSCECILECIAPTPPA